MDKDNIRSRVLKILSTNPSSRELFDCLAKRKQNRREIPLDRFAAELRESVEGVDESRSRQVAVEYFRALDAAELGRFVVGRRGKKTRFLCHVDISDLTEAARNCKSSETVSGLDSDSTTNEVALVRREFPLRENLTLQMDLPTDLTPQEADRLSMFLKSLCI